VSFAAHVLAQVEPPQVGNHLLWSGPYPWVYSPVGWTIERRVFQRRFPLDCLDLSPSELARLRARHVLAIRFGTLTDRFDVGPVALGLAKDIAPANPPLPVREVITLELATPQPQVVVRVQAKLAFTVALRDGKVVAATADVAGFTAHTLSALGIDTVVVYALGLTTLGYCVRREDTDDWHDASTIARLQIPIHELVPSLATPAAEFAEAKSRLLPGESLDEGEFVHLASVLRQIVQTDGPPRPLDLALLVREDVASEFTELRALDPLLSVLPHPKWRRVLGFAYFDRDPALVPGEVYEYRVTGGWPAADLVDSVYGFHTIPSGTPLAAEFYLHDLRVRLPSPSVVSLRDVPTGTSTLTRRGVTLAPERAPFWLGADLDGWSAVIDFPLPVKSVVLEVAAGHALEFAAGAPWMPFASGAPVPPGERPRLDFATPVHQLRLGGRGFLCALRVRADPPGSTAIELVPTVLPPVALVNTPRPAPPLAADVTNLQQPPVVVPDDLPASPPPPKHALGFDVRWLPAPLPVIGAWPPGLPPPPMEAALFQVEHARADAAPLQWEPLLVEENFMTGHRDDDASIAMLAVGLDLMQSFPETRAPQPGGTTLHWNDVFDFPDGGDEVRRPLPDPGTFHRYRVRAVDVIGRSSTAWTETGDARLEKWVPPPLPAGPDPTKADALARPALTGVQARILVQDAPDLTDDERALLGGSSNAILLRWGWHASQREQDRFAAEFRVYATRRRLDALPGTLAAVTDLGNGFYSATLTLDEPVAADASAGLRLDAGYPFEIVTHTGGAAGDALSITLRTRVPQGGVFAQPASGPVLLPIRLTPERTRAPAWGARLETQPIGAANVYESAPIRDLLDLSPDHPYDEAFVGVSVADAQAYVPDPLGAGRPGNESAIVAVPVQARWQGRPEVADAPALADVPTIVTPEPAARPLVFALDLSVLLADSGLSGSERVRPERIAADEIFRAYRTDGTRVIARVPAPSEPGDLERDVLVPNAGDHAAIVAALAGSDVAALADRYAVFLAASHPYKARLFVPAKDAAITLPGFDESLPNRGARYVYRLRLADASGRLSDDGITLRGIVRVPSTTRVPPARRDPAQTDDPRNRLRVRVDGPGEITQVLYFRRQLPPAQRVDDDTELLRVPGATRLAPADAVRLRLGDGTLLAPEVKSLADPDVNGEPPSRTFVLDVPAALGEKHRVWAVAVTRDGVVSALAGPWSLAMPLPPLPAPALAVSGAPASRTFTWTWPSGAEPASVALESSTAIDEAWTRVSAPVAASVATLTYVEPPGAWRYRLRALSRDGRSAYSNEVAP